MSLTQSRLKELLHYDQKTGVFLWLKTTSNRAKVGSVAGSTKDYGRTSYRRIGIDGVVYFAHSLAFLYVTGEYLKYIDHENGDGVDNRFSNLRPCNASQNVANSRLRLNNRSGAKGVHWDPSRKKWLAQIMVGRRHVFLGRFDELVRASAVYADAAEKHFGEFARAA